VSLLLLLSCVLQCNPARASLGLKAAWQALQCKAIYALSKRVLLFFLLCTHRQNLSRLLRCVIIVVAADTVIKSEVDEAMKAVLDSAYYVNGPWVVHQSTTKVQLSLILAYCYRFALLFISAQFSQSFAMMLFVSRA
jgi:hypothetical protein